jgi:hypothetical protein
MTVAVDAAAGAEMATMGTTRTPAFRVRTTMMRRLRPDRIAELLRSLATNRPEAHAFNFTLVNLLWLVVIVSLFLAAWKMFQLRP